MKVIPEMCHGHYIQCIYKFFLTHIYATRIFLSAVQFLPALSVYRMNINFYWKEIQIFKQIINKTFVDISIYTP